MRPEIQNVISCQRELWLSHLSVNRAVSIKHSVSKEVCGLLFSPLVTTELMETTQIYLKSQDQFSVKYGKNSCYLLSEKEQCLHKFIWVEKVINYLEGSFTLFFLYLQKKDKFRECYNLWKKKIGCFQYFSVSNAKTLYKFYTHFHFKMMAG